MAPTVTGSFFCDEPIDTSVRCAPGEVAMLSRNTTHKTPAQIAATVELRQFLKVCNMMLSTGLRKGGFTPNLVAGVEHDVHVCVVWGAGIVLYEVAHTEGCLLVAA
jgi:hypothetical protein